MPENDIKFEYQILLKALTVKEIQHVKRVVREITNQFVDKSLECIKGACLAFAISLSVADFKLEKQLDNKNLTLVEKAELLGVLNSLQNLYCFKSS